VARLRVKYGYTTSDTQYYVRIGNKKYQVPPPSGRWGREPFDVEVDYEWGKREARKVMELLIRARKEADLPGSWIAEKMGVAPEIIYRLESAQALRDPKLSTALRYARAIGIDFSLIEVD
jgi:DNA-binding XRE family transcriptional regulator